MPAESIPRWLGSHKLEAADLSCDWCEAIVPVPEGDLCAVCIDCGMVIFRERISRQRILDGSSGRTVVFDGAGLPATAGT